MDELVSSVIRGYGERIHRVRLMQPLYDLKQLKRKDENGRVIDYFTLGMLALLYFFNEKLNRNYKTGVRELAAFYKRTLHESWQLSDEAYESYARVVVETFRPPGGKGYVTTYDDVEAGEERTLQYKFLKADKHDIETYSQYYTLDEHGLELVFATKEFYGEFQLSINQLLLRRQLEKGEFANALRQIDEMRLNVEELQGRLQKVKHEVQRNIISEETFSRYESMINDIHERLKREDEEFQELQQFVRETRQHFDYKKQTERDEKAYRMMIRIDKELGDVHYEHSMLLKRSIELNYTVLQSAKEAIYQVGVESFNFAQDLTARVFASPLPVSSARVLMNPTLSLEKTEGWSPLAVFERQRLVNQSGEEKEEASFLGVSEEGKEEQFRETQQENFARIMAFIVSVMKGDEMTVQEIIVAMREASLGDWLTHRSFYDFWLILHQRSPLDVSELKGSEEEGDLFERAVATLDLDVQKVICNETNEVLHIEGHYMSDFQLRFVREEFDAI
ncbi:replicative DNA helicase [Texcoconibacillus texcoconensis]|uniref:Replicative DNA helicase n=1 Tax=Texcoconibacillus texcoconensis TaxID=1095777 RepID=A0A840QLW4_9BACI|nr:replicative DNA helicase [Texcoconibacillus texcoconensis]MBB5172365.1 hypothetical protein [Texcoconibacillus texcoconensis]